MFLDENSLENTPLALADSSDALLLNGERIGFEEVVDFFHSFKEHYLNQVYEGKTQEVELRFNNGRENWLACVDSKPTHAHHYATLYQIANHLTLYRQNLQKIAHQQGQTVAFNSKNQRFTLHLTGNNLSLTDHQKNQIWPVTQVIRKGFGLTLKGKHHFQKRRLKLQDISDHISLQLLIQQNITPRHGQEQDQDQGFCYLDGDFQPEKTGTFLTFGAMGIFVLLGLNGWFEWCCVDNDWIAIPSTLSGVFLAIFLFMFALRLILVNPRARAQKERENQLEINAASGKLPQAVKPSNQGAWWAVIAWLVILGIIIYINENSI